MSHHLINDLVLAIWLSSRLEMFRTPKVFTGQVHDFQVHHLESMPRHVYASKGILKIKFRTEQKAVMLLQEEYST